MHIRTIGAAALVGAAIAASAEAGEIKLAFRLVVADTSASVLPVANVEGRTIGSHEAVGVAVFDDDRLAFKRFVYIDDGTEAEGRVDGYSTYTFENGDSLTAKFTGGWSAKGFEGTYDVLSGTGAYAGATGIGAFAAKSFPWEEQGATLFDGTFTLQLPGT